MCLCVCLSVGWHVLSIPSPSGGPVYFYTPFPSTRLLIALRKRSLFRAESERARCSSGWTSLAWVLLSLTPRLLQLRGLSGTLRSGGSWWCTRSSASSGGPVSICRSVGRSVLPASFRLRVVHRDATGSVWSIGVDSEQT